MVFVLIGLVVVLILLLISSPKENFDTYWNHTMGAQKFYERSEQPDEANASKTYTDTERLAKYTWSQRKPNGIQLYDKVYEMTLRDNGRNVISDPTYANRDISGSHIDFKFTTLADENNATSILNGPNRLNPGSSTLTHFTTHGMEEVRPLYTVYNGEHIALSQKTF
jgi:hypothetical protein